MLLQVCNGMHITAEQADFKGKAWFYEVLWVFFPSYLGNTEVPGGLHPFVPGFGGGWVPVLFMPQVRIARLVPEYDLKMDFKEMIVQSLLGH